MGWLGWTYDQVLDTPFAEIERAYEGRLNMLKACFGGGEPEEVEVEPAQQVRLDPEAVKAAFKAAIK